MNSVFTYNQEQASQVGAGQYVSKSGGYDFKITRAAWTSSPASAARFLELDLETREGQKCNYVSICFVKGDGSTLDFGSNMIQAIMGCAQVGNLTDQQGNCPELIGKFLKAVVQRVDYTKNNNDDGYKFDLKLPALLSGQTIKESLANEPAKAFQAYADSIEDKDDRKKLHASSYGTAPAGYKSPQQSKTAAGSSQYSNPGAVASDFDDDVPF